MATTHRPILLRTGAALLAVAGLAAGCGDDDSDDTAAASGSPARASTVEVRAEDYSFSGLPDTLDAGTVRFELDNTGDEIHELAIYRRRDGVDEPIEELLARPDDEIFDLIEPVTEPEEITALPGETAAADVDLAPGRHIVVCLVPVGLTSFDAPPPEDAEPHAARGMAAEFTVE